MNYILIISSFLFIVLLFFIAKYYKKSEKIINRNKGIIEFTKFHKQIICQSTYYNFENFPTETFNYKSFLEKLDQKSCFEFSQIFTKWQANKNFKLPQHKIIINNNPYHIKNVNFEKKDSNSQRKIILEFIPILKSYKHKKTKIRALELDYKTNYQPRNGNYLFLIDLSNHKKYIDKYGYNHYLFLIKKVIKYLQKYLKKPLVINDDQTYYVEGDIIPNVTKLMKKINNFLTKIMFQELFYEENKIQCWGIEIISSNSPNFKRLKTQLRKIKIFSKLFGHQKRILIFNKNIRNEEYLDYCRDLQNIKKGSKIQSLKITPILEMKKSKPINNFWCSKVFDQDIKNKTLPLYNIFTINEVVKATTKIDFKKGQYFWPITLDEDIKISKIKKIQQNLKDILNHLVLVVDGTMINDLVVKNITLLFQKSNFKIGFFNIQTPSQLQEILVFKPNQIFLSKNLIKNILINPILKTDFLKMIKICQNHQITIIALNVDDAKTLNLLYHWGLRFWGGSYLETNLEKKKTLSSHLSTNLNKIIY